jgi:APA family basic amino acid/polyamine antiporter
VSTTARNDDTGAPQQSGPPQLEGRPEEPGKTGKKGMFVLPTATALVIGSVIGTGVFALPTALAPYGPISLVAFVLVPMSTRGTPSVTSEVS